MKLGELTIYEAIIIILVIGLLAFGVDHFRLRQEVGFSKRMAEFSTWQGQVTGAINGLVQQHQPIPQPKPEVKKGP